jgi:2,4-dienoyl-CoA reductase-like NADH-dependent reductase (Old Yellow Enzyme family)
LKPLLCPISLGNLALPNGFIVAPMTTYSSLEDGTISPDELPYLARRAEGGFGAIMTAACYVHPSGKAFTGQWGCDNDDKLESLASVAQAIHSGGAKAILQIHHGGRQCPPKLAGGECISASAIAAESHNASIPREMTDDEIERTIQDFAQATRRAKLSGFDGVEIHGANTYLVQQFVSPHSNRRTDKWNAADLLFPKRLVETVLQEVGTDFPVGYRFSSEEPETPGIRLEQTRNLIDELCKFQLSFFHISLRSYDQPSIHNQGDQSVLRQIANHINGRLPLIGVGSIRTSQDVPKALGEGAGALAIGRGAICDPDWVNHYQNDLPIRSTLNKANFPESYVLPAGLAKRVEDVPGWFDFDE